MSKPAPAAPTKPAAPTPSKKKSEMVFFPAKGLGSYHAFGATDDKGKKLFRSAVLQYGSLSALPNADQALASVLPKGFASEASAQGWTLKEVMTEAQAFYAALPASPKVKRETVDYDTRRLAGILAGLTPNDGPAALLKELKGLIETKAESALQFLTRMEQNAGRDTNGYIYLRRVSREAPE